MFTNNDKIIFEKLTAVFQSVYNSNENNMESALIALRKNGASQIQCVRILKSQLGISLREADSKVLYSKTWEDCRASTIDLRRSFWEGGEELSEE